MAHPDKRRRNVLAIIEMFSNLGLPVCDDEAEIKAKRDEQRSARNRELNSTKGTVAARAQKWFDNVNALLSRRDELLTIVYSEFASLADAVLCSHIERGETSLGADTQTALRELAMSWCRARPDLANRWLQEYLESRGLHEGQSIDKPMLVRNFKATVRAGHVQLSWTYPADRCDEVKIVRSPDPARGDTSEVTVYQGTDTRFTDANVSPKGHYVYRAYTVFEGRRSLTSCSVSTKNTSSGSRTGAWVAVAAVALAAAGAYFYDQFLPGADAPAPAPSARAWVDLSSSVVEAPVETVEVPDAGDTAALETDPAAPDDDAAEQPGAADAEELADAEPAESVPSEPFVARMIDEPSLAFAGQSLRVELDLPAGVRPALLEPELVGLRVKRLDLETVPPAIVFQVDELEPDTYAAQASWSFRLADSDGRPSTVVTGTCEVMPSGD